MSQAHTMKRAHEIRRHAAKRWGCSVGDIIWSACLEMAHNEAQQGIQTATTRPNRLQAMANLGLVVDMYNDEIVLAWHHGEGIEPAHAAAMIEQEMAA